MVCSFQDYRLKKRKWLEWPFDECEIKIVVWSIEDNKASGPDGCTMAFFKSYWDVVK